MKKKINILLLLLACCVSSQGQECPGKKYMNWWYFGENSGLNFNQMQTVNGVELPMSVVGPLYIDEGCFTLSDKDGNLLMSSDGVTVYNKDNQVMDNGTGLFGNESATQSGIVIPMPGNDMQYYIVTVDYTSGTNGINYSVVDLSQNMGLGKVIIKNVKLKEPTYEIGGNLYNFENIAAVPHTNETDYWLIHREGQTFYVWAITASGFSSPQTYTGASINLSGTLSELSGELRFSPDNTKLASVSEKSIIGANFDPSSGVVSNIYQNTNLPERGYGLEFSPSGEYLYVGIQSVPLNQGFFRIKFDDLMGGSSFDQLFMPSSDTSSRNEIINLKIGPDNRIYAFKIYYHDLVVIMNPDAGGTDIRVFNDYLINKSWYGLPNFPNTSFCVFSEVPPTTCTTYPSLLSMDITASGTNIPATLEWNFGDGSSVVTVTFAGNGTYTQSHTYSTKGTYTFTITPIKSDGTRLDAVTQQIGVIDCPIRTNRMIRTNLPNAKHE